MTIMGIRSSCRSTGSGSDTSRCIATGRSIDLTVPAAGGLDVLETTWKPSPRAPCMPCCCAPGPTAMRSPVATWTSAEPFSALMTTTAAYCEAAQAYRFSDPDGTEITVIR